MAILKQRLHVKNSSGGYDTVHLETSSDIVLMSDGSTTLTSKISTMDTTIDGKLDSSGTAASATKLATARTIRTNLASTSTASFNGTANITPGVTGTLPITNGGTGNTTGLAASATQLETARNIQTNLASTTAVSFDGTADVTPGVTGVLPIANGGTGAGGVGNLKTLVNLPIVAGDTYSWAGYDWIVVDVDNYTSGIVYLALSTIYSKVKFGDNNTYSGSTIASAASDFEASISFTDLAQAVDTTVDGVTAKIFIPSYDMAYSGFQWFTTSANRIATYNGTKTPWFLSTPFTGDTNNTTTLVYNVGSAGSVYDTSVTYAYGFRPCVGLSIDIASIDISSGVSGVLPIANGGTGNTTGLAASATKLATSRTIRTNLASTSTASFNGTANITPGVTGTLPIANGGTGNTTGLAATATALATAQTIQTDLASTSSASFDGTAAVTPGITGTLAIAHGGTGKTTGPLAQYALTSASSALTSSTLATGDYIPIADTSAATGKKITIANLTTYLNDNLSLSSGSSDSATKLETARSIQTNLASTTAASFDGTADITPGVTGTLPIANGGTGNTTGLAASATKLATARTIRTNLASTSTVSFNGTANITPGVTGTLPVANGGTGVTSLDSLKSSLGITSSTVTAPDYPSSIPAVGSELSFAGLTWIVVHKNAGVAFLCLKTITTTCAWSSITYCCEYFGSNIWCQCNEFAATYKLYACDYLIPMCGCPVFIPSADQLNSKFSYFSSASARIAYNSSGTATAYWTSTPHEGSSSGSATIVYDVYMDGTIYGHYYASDSIGFRPCVAIRL